MKRRYTSVDFSPENFSEHSRKTAIHEAGHAASIYLGNKHKQLPPVYFQICIKNLPLDITKPDCLGASYEKCIAKVEGGRLIHTLPLFFEKIGRDFSLSQQIEFTKAFEADIINLMVGPLAEAYYIATRDGELISPRLVNLNALYNYGGSSDIAIIYEYMNCFITCDLKKQEKISELFLAAYQFIMKPEHWTAITALAEYILRGNTGIIDYSEITTVLDSYVA